MVNKHNKTNSDQIHYSAPSKRRVPDFSRLVLASTVLVVPKQNK